MRNRSSAYYTLGAVPLLFQGGVWFLAEAIVSLGALLFLSQVLRLTTISPLAYTTILVVVLAVGETTKRSVVISRVFFGSLWRLWVWASSTIKRFLKNSFISLSFLLVTLAFVVIFGKLIVLGLQSPFTDKPDFAKELFVSVLTIVIAVIAIFFAGAALVVEIILGAYTSQLFVRAFVRHWIFLLSLVLMILIAIANLLPLRFGWNESLVTASLCSAIYVILCLGILVILLTRFLQVPLIVREVTSQILAHIRKDLPRPRVSLRQLQDQPSAYHQLLDKLKFAFEFYILGRFPRTPLHMSVPAEFSEGLQEHIRPIFSACLRAIKEDRRDIVLACLDSVVAVGSSYLEARRDYALPDDPFMVFLFSQFEILFNAALQEANEQFTADIIEAAGVIGQASLSLTESQIRPDVNRIAAMWSRLLAKSCLKSLPLRHTSAPVAACEGITQIGRGLLAQGAYTTAIYVIADDLKQVGIQTASAKGIWPSSITQQAIWGLVLMLNDVFNLALDKGQYQEYASKTLCDALDSITKAAFIQERGFDAYTTISAPLVGPLWLRGNIVNVLCWVLRASREGVKPTHHRLVSDAISVAELIYHTGLRVIAHSGISAQYSSALSEMSWCTVQFLKDQPNPRLIREGRNLLRTLLQAAHNYVKRGMKENPDMIFDHLRHLSPIYAFMVYFAQDSIANQVLVDELFVAMEELSKLLSELGEIDRDTAAYRKFYSYMKMYAAWVYKYFPKNPLVSKLLHSLARNAPPEVDMPWFIDSQMERFGYPSAFVNGSWYIFPSRHWKPDFQQTITDELNDLENYSAFDALLRDLKAN